MVVVSSNWEVKLVKCVNFVWASAPKLSIDPTPIFTSPLKCVFCNTSNWFFTIVLLPDPKKLVEPSYPKWVPV